MTQYACNECGALSETVWCPLHGNRNSRASSGERGYKSKTFLAARKQLLADNPLCVTCGKAKAVVADHHPIERKVLVKAGIENPDAIGYLRPMCRKCHNSKSASTHSIY